MESFGYRKRFCEGKIHVYQTRRPDSVVAQIAVGNLFIAQRRDGKVDERRSVKVLVESRSLEAGQIGRYSASACIGPVGGVAGCEQISDVLWQSVLAGE